MFALFGGDNYYPRGGWKDFIAIFDDLDVAIEYSRQLSVNANKDPGPGFWWHIVDTRTAKIIRSLNND